MKSIILVLTLGLWTQSFPGFSQTDSTYCLPIQKARLLVADAVRLRLADSLLQRQSERLELLESEKIAVYNSFTNLLNISQQKFQKQKEITGDFVRLSDSWKGESEYYMRRLNGDVD